MLDLIIEDTTKTPSVEFLINGELRIAGRSIPENAVDFFNPLINWVKSLKASLPPSITFTVELEYINTSSSKLLLDLFRILDGIFLSNKSKVEIIWMYDYEDEDSRDESDSYISDLSVPFTLKAF